MNRLLTLARRYPFAAVALGIAVVVLVWLFLSNRATTVVTPVPTSEPTPAATPGPVIAAPQPVPTPVVIPPPPPPQAAGRADPFVPLVRSQAARPGPVSLPPPAPLPPPLFPGGPGPGVPGGTPPSPVAMATTAQLVGVLGDTGRVAIIRLGGKVYIVAQGEMIEERIRVELVDAKEGLVVLIENGQRFEVRFAPRIGGVNTPHVAHRSSYHA